MDRGDAGADDHCVTDRCLPTPPIRRRMRSAALMVDLFDGPSGIAMILMMELRALDPFQDRPPRCPQVALAAAGGAAAAGGGLWRARDAAVCAAAMRWRRCCTAVCHWLAASGGQLGAVGQPWVHLGKL